MSNTTLNTEKDLSELGWFTFFANEKTSRPEMSSDLPKDTQVRMQNQSQSWSRGLQTPGSALLQRKQHGRLYSASPALRS